MSYIRINSLGGSIFSVGRMNEIKSRLKIEGKLLLSLQPKFTLSGFQPSYSSSHYFLVHQYLHVQVLYIYSFIFLVEYYSGAIKSPSITISKSYLKITIRMLFLAQPVWPSG